ncbi:MAG: peptidase C13 [Alphaproteobacteria bacterium]|nr:peptidase C13 [Alphaproteobacteria bacterium]
MLVAGDDSSPAFDNGVDALARLLTAQGVSDMRMLTASYKRFGPERGWATRANLATALAGIAPDEGEGCLVYMTSHGEERGLYLSRDAGGLLTPESLAAMLDSACRQLPTIVVVSACHSGAFLKPLVARDNRILLTAARADRASFGCSPTDELTFYDRCFIMSFPLSDGWPGLHRDVARCVGAAEQRLTGIEPSEPQAFFGRLVRALPLPGLRSGGRSPNG